MFNSPSLIQRPLIQQRYQLLQCLGQGHFAQTYLGRDLQQAGEPLVVLKQMQPIQNNPTLAAIAQTFFCQEVQLLQWLEAHTEIPSLLQVFTDQDEQYLVQTFISGYSVQEEFNQGSPWTEAQLLNFLARALKILADIHDEGVIHRDLKPAHWIWRQETATRPLADGAPLALIDFGAAERFDWASQAEVAGTSQPPPTLSIGTHAYMAPEQLRGDADVRSDLYALGLIAIQGIAGMHPTQLNRNAQGELRWQSIFPIRDAVTDIVARMVRYWPEDRYGSSREVLSDLQPYARSPLWSRRVSRWLGLGSRSAPQRVLPDLQGTANTIQRSPIVSRHPSGWSRATALLSAWNDVPGPLLAELESAVSTHLWISDGLVPHPGRVGAQQAGLDAAFQSTDVYIVCLTPESVVNPKLLQQLQWFEHSQQQRCDRPARLIPVRIHLELDAPLPDAVRQALRQVRQYVWRSPTDTPRILAAIQGSSPDEVALASVA